MTKNDSISVIIPTYNSATFISEAIESVLMQSYSPYEIIIIDDGSTDGTEEIVKKFGTKVQYVYQENQGPSPARNKGIKMANGNYVAFIDADDVWMPESLSCHVDQFKEFNNLDISIGLTCKMGFNKTSDIDIKKAKQESALHLSLCASLIKKSVFNDVGFFDEDLILSQDTDWFLRAREAEKRIAISRELVSLYRRHSNNRTNNKKMVNYYLFKVFKKAKDRRVHSKIALNSDMKKPENQDELIDIWHNAQLRN